MSEEICRMCGGNQEYEIIGLNDKTETVKCSYCTNGFERETRKRLAQSTAKTALDAAIAAVEKES